MDVIALDSGQPVINLPRRQDAARLPGKVNIGSHGYAQVWTGGSAGRWVLSAGLPRPDVAVDALARQIGGPGHRDWRTFSRVGTCPAEVPVDPAHELVTVVRMEPVMGGSVVCQ